MSEVILLSRRAIAEEVITLVSPQDRKRTAQKTSGDSRLKLLALIVASLGQDGFPVEPSGRYYHHAGGLFLGNAGIQD